MNSESRSCVHDVNGHITLKKRKHLSHDSKNENLDFFRNSEKEYFLSYADVELHRTMIEDKSRTNTYREAILRNADTLIKGKVIADVGCGTGILSMFCAQAGAKKVYAIDASDIATHAEKLVDINGFQNIISVIKSRAEDVELPEKVDVIVSEWMGYMLLYETMLPSVIHIRDNYLKPDGKMFPEKAFLYMALGESPFRTRYEESSFDFWVSLNIEYGLEMSLLAEESIKKLNEIIHIHMVSQEDLISLPTKVCELDLCTVSSSDLAKISHNFTLNSMGYRNFNCLILWFDVIFPGDVKLSTSPHNVETHWQNTVLLVEEEQLIQDSIVKGCVKIAQDSKFYRFLNVELEYGDQKGKSVCRKYLLNEDSS